MSPARACQVSNRSGSVERVEHLDPADRDRTDRVTVVRVLEADEAGALELTALCPPLEGHLQRHLDRGRAAVGVEHAAEPGGRDPHQPFGQLDRRLVGEAEHRRVCDPPELLPDRRVDRRVSVPVNVAPQRRDPVDVDVPVGVEQVGALRVVDHDRRLLAAPALLLRERMPDSDGGRPRQDRSWSASAQASSRAGRNRRGSGSLGACPEADVQLAAPVPGGSSAPA